MKWIKLNDIVDVVSKLIMLYFLIFIFIKNWILRILILIPFILLTYVVLKILNLRYENKLKSEAIKEFRKKQYIEALEKNSK